MKMSDEQKLVWAERTLIAILVGIVTTVSYVLW
jgi:hypothetical protein